MSRELPLLIGAIGAVLGVLSFLLGSGEGFFFLLYYCSRSTLYCTPSAVSSTGVRLVWLISPCFGLAGAYTVKRHGKLGGILFLTAGLVPWLYGLLVWPSADPLFLLLWFFWTPLVVLAGILAVLDWPGPYVDPEELAQMKEEEKPSS